jgi:2-polyprenyl-6-methoxyphenol hydroxylase-like FAD-dependent oxidoreductase
MDEPMDVIVVGGGPVGLMTAALLDRAGVRVEVYEQGGEPSRESRGTTMHPRTLEVLSMLDAGDGRRVSDVLLAQGRLVPEAHYAALPAMLDYRNLDTPFPHTLTLPQWHTEHALAAYLKTHGVPVHYGAEVTEAEQTADGVRVLAGGEWHTTKYLIGADGAHSRIRKALGVGFPGSVPDGVGWVGDVYVTEPLEKARHHWHQELGHANVVPLGGAVARIYGTHARDTRLSVEELRRRQAEPITLAELTTALKGICGTDFGAHDASWLARTTNTGRHVSEYRVGRIFLVGDAAHVHFPAGGQGFNVGLQDATNLAWKLAAEVQGWAPERLISGDAGYDAERRPIAEKLIASTQAQDALMHTFTASGAALRDLLCDFISSGGQVADELSGWLSGLAVAYPGPEGTHPLTGTRAPDLTLEQGTLMRALSPDRFLLLDFTPAGQFAQFGSERVEVRRTIRPGREGWGGVRVVLVRPDGYIAHASSSSEGLADAIAAWTESDRRADGAALAGAVGT